MKCNRDDRPCTMSLEQSNTNSNFDAVLLPVRGGEVNVQVNVGAVRDYLRTNKPHTFTLYIYPERDNGLSYLRLATCIFSIAVQENRPTADVVLRRRIDGRKPFLDKVRDTSQNREGSTSSAPPVLNEWLPMDLQDYAYGDLSDDFYNKYETVAVGGTFDRLHAGHRLLLTAAVWAAEQTLRIGVTSDTMLQAKEHKDLIQSLDTRCESAVAYSKRVKPSVPNVLVTHLTDSSGPTSYEPAINALVVSKETAPGALKINDVRIEAGLNPMTFIIVDVLDTKGVKLSSSALRKAEAGQKLQSNTI